MKLADGAEVAVYSEDGRSSQLATFHGWQRKDDGWHAHVMVYGDYRPGIGSGMYRDCLPAHRVLPLVYCGRFPSGQIAHTETCRQQAHLGASPDTDPDSD